MLGKYIDKKGMMKMYYIKPTLKILTQGWRIVVVKQFRLMTQDEVFDKLGIIRELIDNY